MSEEEATVSSSDLDEESEHGGGNGDDGSEQTVSSDSESESESDASQKESKGKGKSKGGVDDGVDDEDDEDSSEYSEESSFDEGSASSSHVRQGVPVKEAKAWLSQKEAKLIGFMNAARTKPKKFAITMNDMKGTHFRRAGEIWKPDYDVAEMYMPIQTRERLEGFGKAIEYVKKQPEMQRLRVSKGLCMACQDLVADQFEHGARGHITSDASSFRDRAERYGTVVGDTLTESLVYGHDGALENCAWMVFSDGKRDRKDRNNIFNPGLNLVGVAMGAHPEWGATSCILFAEQYEDSEHPERDEALEAKYEEAREENYRVRKSAQGCCVLQ